MPRGTPMTVCQSVPATGGWVRALFLPTALGFTTPAQADCEAAAEFERAGPVTTADETVLPARIDVSYGDLDGLVVEVFHEDTQTVSVWRFVRPPEAPAGLLLGASLLVGCADECGDIDVTPDGVYVADAEVPASILLVEWRTVSIAFFVTSPEGLTQVGYTRDANP